MEELTSFLQRLSQAPGISGHEDSVRAIVSEALEEHVDDIRFDKLGNLIATRNGSESAVMVAAHLDEIGLMVKHVDDKGFIRFVKFGGWFDQTLLNNRVVVHAPRGDVYGVIGSKPPHIMKSEEKKKTVKAEDMFIDVGIQDRQEADALGIRPGTPITLDRSLVTLQGHRVCGKALDDRAGVAMMVEAVRQTAAEVTVYAVGTVQEEVGLKGARTSAFGLDPDAALVSETAVAGDHPGIEEKDAALKLGEGPALTVTDASGRGLIASPSIMRWLEDTARQHDIPYQLEVSSGGTTDATAIHLTRAGVPCGVVSVPTRYLHSGVEVLDLRDLQSGARLMARALEAVGSRVSL
ncbi:MAG TPA: M42 family peptidase [Thermoplasmatales archaeon]|nr:M42 family peptidase [Thermoplasmatales archaeon]